MANMAQLHALEERANRNAHRLLGNDEAAPEDMSPHFLTKLRNLDLREGKRAHFEAKLEPITDPHLQVEWRAFCSICWFNASVKFQF